MTPFAPAGDVVEALTSLLVLTEREREAWVDYHIVGLSQTAIAVRDGCGKPIVCRRLKRAEQKLLKLREERRVDEVVAA